jgi:hypothetical protein
LLRGVDAGGCVICCENPDIGVVFEGAELFERFGLFEGGGRPSDKGFKKIAAIAVDAFVAEDLEVFDRVSKKGQRGAGKIEGVAVEFDDDFYDIGIGDGGVGGVEGVGGGDHVQRRVAAEGGGESIDEFGIDEGFIALDIEDMGGVGDLFDGLGEAVCAGGMIGGGHHGFATEGSDGLGDAIVIGRNQDFREFRGMFAAFPNVLDQGFSCDEVERFPREAGGAPACWENADDVMLRSRK